MSIITNQLTPNIVEKILYSRGVWELNLNYDTNKINDIVNQVYNLEKEAYSSSTGRTFIQKKGFHSENLIKVPFFKPIINDILKLVNNELATILKRKDKYGNFAKNPNFYFVTEDVWTVIWRKGDFNAPHRHPDNHIAGAFYFKVPSSPNSGGELAISNINTNQLPINDTDMSNGMSLRKLSPKLGHGILFRADLEHFVLPSYTDEDRICIACNFKLKNIQFNQISPAPNWRPHSLNYTFPDNNSEIEEIKNTGIIKYKLIDGTYLRFPNPYNGDLNQVRGKSFVIEFEQTS